MRLCAAAGGRGAVSPVRYTFGMSLTIQHSVPLAPYTTFRIGGPAEHFTSVSDSEKLHEAVAWAQTHGKKITVLGGGSNMLVAGEGVRGLVIKMDIGGALWREQDDVVFVTAGAGVVFDALIAESVSRGYWGLENLSAIPGSVGAVPVQNVGAYGVEVAECIHSVDAYDPSVDAVRTLDPAACMFGYRDSYFKRPEANALIITAVTFALSKHASPKIAYKDLHAHFGDTAYPAIGDIRDAVMRIRAEKFPDWSRMGTAGSFFKNPFVTAEAFAKLKARYPDIPGFPSTAGKVKVPLGWILDRVLSLRGYREGNVGTYEGQALVIVNHGGASAHEVETFAEHIRSKVKQATDINIEWEVRFVS